AKQEHEDVETPRRVLQRSQQIVGDRIEPRFSHAVCRARYVIFGTVPTSSSSLAPRDDSASRETSLSGSFRSPKTMALVGHAWAHAGLISPSLISRFSASASILTALIRCTQKVHFSMTPTSRTDTSGLSCRWSGLSQAGLKKSKKRTLYG